MKRIFLLLILLCVQEISEAQSSTDKKHVSLKIGDKIPDLTINNLINYPSASEKMSAFKGKLLILYFWNEDCESSIHGWPKLLTLQQKFKNDLQIILVNESQEEHAVRKIINDQSRIVKVKMTLPIVCLDHNLNEWFPRKTVPHIVWIDTEGRLISITSADQVNERNLTSIITKQQTTMPQKEGVKYKVDFSQPLFIQANGGNGDHLQWQSVVSGYFPGLYSTMFIDSTYGVFSNSMVTTMFRYLFKEQSNRFGALNLFPDSRIQLKVRDTSRYCYKVNGEVQSQNFYTYQLYSKVPRSEIIIRSIMLADIKRYFGVDCYWDKQRKMCLVLSATDTTKLTYKSGTPIAGITATGMDLNNITPTEMLQNLLAVTDYHVSSYPLLDETGIKGKIGIIKFDADVLDHRALNRALNPFGLTFTLQPREVDVLVIYETGFFKPGRESTIAN